MRNNSKITSSLFIVAFIVILTAVAFGQTTPTRVMRVNEAAASGQRPGSVLVYNAYTSDATTGNANTQFNITNTNSTSAIGIHLFFISDTCHVSESWICLTPSQTGSFLASDVDPGTTGYLIAVATALTTGCPIGFNFMVGSEEVRFRTGHAASLPAESFQALFSGVLPGCTPNDTRAILNFDGRAYSPVPRTLALNTIPSRANANDTMLIINTFSGALDRQSREPVPQYYGLLYDDAENVVSFTFGTQNCQLRNSLTNSFPRITPRFETFIPDRRSGWLQIYALREAAITGAAINFNGNDTSAGFAFSGGYNLYHLNYTSGQLTIPVFQPSC